MKWSAIKAFLCGRSRKSELWHIQKLSREKVELEKKAQFYLLHQDSVNMANVNSKWLKVNRELNGRVSRYEGAWGKIN